jgi:gamma-glutamyltranspeptidase
MSRQTGVVMNNQMDDFASPNIGTAFALAFSFNNMTVILKLSIVNVRAHLKV